jgi:FkbM family methyltransferase
MERLIQRVIQRVFGFDRYLFWFSRFKIRTLQWDRNERDILYLISRMPADATVLDIGANIGIMTVLIARHVHRGHVHAFEPIPENFRALERVVAHFGLTNVTLHQMALGETSGRLEMVMPEEQHVRMQGLSHAVEVGDTDTATQGRRYTVPQERLDDLEFLRGVQVDGIKIDVEGYEQFVFKGGRELLQRCRPLVYAELVEPENRSGSFGLFADLGYSSGVLVDDHIVAFDPSRHTQHNFFMSPSAAPA